MKHMYSIASKTYTTETLSVAQKDRMYDREKANTYPKKGKKPVAILKG